MYTERKRRRKEEKEREREIRRECVRKGGKRKRASEIEKMSENSKC
jgi:hypothetical protein